MPRGHDKTANSQRPSKVTPKDLSKTLQKTSQSPFKVTPKDTSKVTPQRPYKKLPQK